MKKILKKLVTFITLLSVVLVANSFIVLADTAPSTTSSDEVYSSPFVKLQEIAGKTGLPQYNISGGTGEGPHSAVATTSLGGEAGIAEIASPLMYAIDLFRFAITGIAVVVIVIMSLRLISTSTEEEAAKAKNGLTMGVLGFLIIQMADMAVKSVFFGEEGELFDERGTYLETYLTSERGGLEFFRGILGFVNLFVAAVAVLVLVVRGFKLIVSGGDEESMGKAKKHILYAIIGIVVVGISEVVVRGIIFPAKYEDVEFIGGQNDLQMLDVDKANQVIIDLTSYMASFISILAFLALFFAGYKYVISGGNEEAAQSVKKTIISAVIAIALALGAFAIVNTLMDVAETEATISDTMSVTNEEDPALYNLQ